MSEMLRKCGGLLVILCLAIGTAAQTAATADPKIDAIAQELLQKTGVPSASIAVVKDGRIVYRQAYGSAKLDPKALFYRSQRLKVRFLRMVEAIERLIGARPGQKLEVNFRAATLEDPIRRAGRRLAIGLTAGAAVLASGLTAVSERVPPWVPVTFGVVGGLLTLSLVVDLFVRRR